MSFSGISRRLHGLDAFLKVLLCVVLVVSLCPPLAGAFAEESDGQDADKLEVAAQVDESAVDGEAAEGEADAQQAADDGGEAADALADEPAADTGKTAPAKSGKKAGANGAQADDAGDDAAIDDAAADGDANTTNEPEAVDTGAEAVVDEPAASEESSSSSAQLDGVTMLKAKAKGIRATLLVDASAELPAGAKLVVTPLVKHEAASEADAAETGLQDEEASDESGDYEAADAEEATLEAQQADDEATDEADADVADEDEAVASEGDEATDSDSEATTDEPTKITGAQAALSGMTKAVQAYRAKKKAGEATVVDAYAIEVVDAEGNVVPVDDDAAKLTVTLEDGDEDAADYDKVYAVERDAEEQQSVSENAETEYADEDAAAEEIPYQAEATDVTESAKTDEQAEETTVELDGVRSIATMTEDLEAAENADVNTDSEPQSRAKALNPRKAPSSSNPTTRSQVPEQTKLMDRQTMYDNIANGLVINLFDYDACDIAPVGGRDEPDQNDYNGIYYVKSDGVINDINYNGTHPNTDAQRDKSKTNAHQLQFYSHGNIGFPDGTNNDINQFAGLGIDGNSYAKDYKQQYANQGIVSNELNAQGYPTINRTNGESLQYLFDPETTHGGKTSYPNVNRLFYEENGMLTYDSNNHYAYYLSDDKEFAVYKDTYNRKSDSGDMKVGFFPFDPYTGINTTAINPTSGRNIDVHHHFGMTMSTQIVMPYKGKIYNSDAADGVNPYQDMVFRFSGDDDMWVFVDDQLVLDIGGIHQPVAGEINFATGMVTISSGTPDDKKYENGKEIPFNRRFNDNAGDSLRDNFYRVSSGTLAEQNGVRTDKMDMWEKVFNGQWDAGTTHTVKVFYTERGGCDSNLMISTNIHKMTKLGVDVQKNWDESEADVKNQPVEVELIQYAKQRKVLPSTTEDGDVVVIADENLYKGSQIYRYIDYDGVKEYTNSTDDQVQIDGRAYDVKEARATLNEGNSWFADWYNLPKEGYRIVNGNKVYCDFEYYVREVPSTNYRPSYRDKSTNPATLVSTLYDQKDNGANWESKGANGSYVKVDGSKQSLEILNKQLYTSVDVQKVWDGCTPPSGSIWVRLSNTDSSFTPVVKELKPNDWTAKFEKLPISGVYKVMEGTSQNGPFVESTISVGGSSYSWASTNYYQAPNADNATPQTTGLSAVEGYSGKAVITNGPNATKIRLKKTDAGATAETTIAGAKFKLYRDDGAGTTASFNKDTDAVDRNLVKRGDVFEFVTGDNGTIDLPDLVPGTYWLMETEAPEGYLVRDAEHPIGITVPESGAPTLVLDENAYNTGDAAPRISSEADNGVYTLTVPNLRTYALPATAGPGILELIFLGAFAMTLALGLRRRRPAGSPSAGVAPRGKRSGKPRH